MHKENVYYTFQEALYVISMYKVQNIPNMLKKLLSNEKKERRPLNT